MHIPYDDAQKALQHASTCVAQGQWRYHHDALGRRHAYERQFHPEKDPNLRPPEIEAAFLNGSDCRHAGQGHDFFRLDAYLEAWDWAGWGRILFYLEKDAAGEAVVVVTAYRIRGWRKKDAGRRA